MKRKAWDITLKDNPNRIVMVENDEFYTTDTEAFLVFNLKDEGFYPQSAMLTLENRNDGSLKSEEVEVIDGGIQWEMPERFIEHSGKWSVQLVYEQMKGDVPEKYTSGVMAFTVNSHIKDNKKPRLVEIENWEKFIREGTELIETWEDMETLREENERQRQEHENQRDSNENTRQEQEVTRENQESIRESQEVTRENQESIRESQEVTRENQESIRESQEVTRVESDRERAETFESWGEIIDGTIYDDTEIRGLIDNKADKQDLISHLATTGTDGLMSSTDKTKLDGIETGAEKNTITSVQGRTGAVSISKSDVGLGNVNNVAITSAQVTKLNELNYTKAMTQAQYDALSTAEKNRTDVWYGIYEE